MEQIPNNRANSKATNFCLVKEEDLIHISTSGEVSEPKAKKDGRPIVYKENLKTVTIRLTESNYEFAKRNGWEFGGYTGYINHLIEEKRNETFRITDIT